jgi:hypothetical protein
VTTDNGPVWTLESLKTYFERIIADQSTSINKQAEAQDRAVNAALVAQEKMTSAALASADKAVDKAEQGAEKWRESANEWRGAMSDRERTFITRAEFDQMNKSMKESIDRLESSVNTMSGNKAGRTETWAFLFGAIGIAFGAIAAFLR